MSQSSHIKMVLAPTDEKPDSPNIPRCAGRTSLAASDCRVLHPSVGTYQPISVLQVAAGLQDTRMKNHFPSQLPVSAALSSSHARTIAPSSGLPVLGQFGRCVSHHHPAKLPSRKPTVELSHNNSLLDLLLDPTGFFSRSRHSIDQSIPPFNRPVYPTVQSTTLSHRSLDQSIPPLPP